MKNLHTQATHKYAEALKALHKSIETNQLSIKEFLSGHELPAHFIKACANLNFVGRCHNGKYTVALHEEIKDIHGRMISLEIIHIEKIRRMKFKAKNKAA
jgi:hypothetical protein